MAGQHMAKSRVNLFEALRFPAVLVFMCRHALPLVKVSLESWGRTMHWAVLPDFGHQNLIAVVRMCASGAYWGNLLERSFEGGTEI